MGIKVVLFDLDGTLLPMEQEKFVKSYFGSLAKKLAPYGFEPEKLIESIWAGMKAMVTNNTDKTNKRQKRKSDYTEKHHFTTSKNSFI